MLDEDCTRDSASGESGKPAPHKRGLELLSRIIQLPIRSYLFDAPILSSLKLTILRRLFDLEQNVQINALFFFKRPHALRSPGLSIRSGASINHNVEIDYSGGVTIESDVWISQNVLIETHDHRIEASPKSQWGIETSPLQICEDAWIGANAIITASVTRIGKGAIVGAGAIVTKNVEDFEIVAGSPAKKIRDRPRY